MTPLIQIMVFTNQLPIYKAIPMPKTT